MHLSRRAKDFHTYRVGDAVIARPPTVRTALRGVIVEVERTTLTLVVGSEWIAVDIEDCDPPEVG